MTKPDELLGTPEDEDEDEEGAEEVTAPTAARVDTVFVGGTGTG